MGCVQMATQLPNVRRTLAQVQVCAEHKNRRSFNCLAPAVCAVSLTDMLGTPQSAAAGAQYQKGTSDGDGMAQVEAFVRVQKRTPAERAREREREQTHTEAYNVLGSEV